MITVFAGEDTFESYRKAKAEVELIASKKNLSVKIINADELVSIDAFLAHLESIDMFSESSVILAKRLLSNKKLIDYITENLDRLQEYDIVVWHDGKPDGRSKVVKLLKQKKMLYECLQPNEREVTSWIEDQSKEMSITLSRQQIRFIIESLDASKGLIYCELEKIELYTQVKKKSTISDSELEKLLGFDVKGNMWKFLDAFGARNKMAALKEFEKLTAFEDNVQMLIAMISRELDILLQIATAQEKGVSFQSLKLHPFVLNKAKGKIKNFSAKQLQILIKKLFDLDFAIKTGRIEQRLGMTLYLMKL